MTNPIPKFSSLTKRLAGPRSRAWKVTDRAANMERGGREVIHLGVGDPDFDTPPKIVAEAITALERGRTHYSPIVGEPELRKAIAQSYVRDFHISVVPDAVTVFPGAQCALFATLLCLAGPGDEVILLEPFYATYEGVACAGGATVISVPLRGTTHFDFDIDRVEQAITKKTRVILTNSPGNPSGAVFSEASTEALLALCIENGIWLVSDEVYANLVFDGKHRSPLHYAGSEQNVVVISSVSKSHAMTGWRLGWAIACAELNAHLERLAQSMLFGVCQFTQDAAIFALSETKADVMEMQLAFHARRNTLCDSLETIDQLTVHRPAGGMFVMVDVKKLGIDGEEFANRLLDHSGVAVVPGFAFGDSTKNYVRIGFLHDEATLNIAADKIKDFVSSISA